MLGTDPDNSFNILMGRLVLLLWEYCDCLNMTRVPKDPDATETTWYLTDFINKKVAFPVLTPRSFPVLQLFNLILAH